MILCFPQRGVEQRVDVYYIPYYLDGVVQTALVGLWVIVGVIGVIRGLRQSLPADRLVRRAGIAAGCAFASLVVYTFYVLQRQTVEKAHHVVFGKDGQSLPRINP
jgi:hypothetical protein